MKKVPAPRSNVLRASLAATLVSACVAACVGDNGTPDGGAAGADGGVPGSGADGSVIQGGGQDGGNGIITDAGGADAVTDADTPDVGVDAGPQCNTAFTPPTYTCGPVNIACYDDSASAHSCVASSMSCLQSAYTTPIEFGCFSQLDCKNGEYCCTSYLQINTTACPGTITYGASGGGACGNTVGTPGSCPVGERILCSSKAGCPGGKTCWPVTAQDPPSLANQSFGICL